MIGAALVALALAHATTPDAHAAFAATRVPMCQAIVQEMYTEIHKHSLRKNGEDDIYETVPAICLAIVQNFTLTKTKPPKSDWVLTKRATRLDDDDTPPDAAAMQHLLTLKQVCELFTDEFQQELSELMYRAVNERDADAIEAEFCSSAAVTTSPPPPPPPRKRKEGSGARTGGEKKKKKEKKAKAPPKNDEPDMAALLKKYDTDGSISNLLEMERENPEGMLEADDLAQVEIGASEIRCDVCQAVAKVAVTRAKKAKILRDEEKLSSMANLLCYGNDPNDLDVYPKYPGNPPLWGELYTVQKVPADGGKASEKCVGCGDGVWRMRRLPKGSKPEEKRMGEGGIGHDQMIMKHSMISRACKAVVLAPDSAISAEDADDLPDLAQTLFQNPADTGTQLAERYCKPFCSSSSRSSRSATRGKDEL